MKRIAIVCGLLVSALAAIPATAMTFMQVDYVCPVGGERFSAQTMGSGTAFGHFLDGRLQGAIQSPWPLVQCPGNGFVIYQETFSEDELARLTPYVQGEVYQRMRGKESSYWLLSQLLEVVGAPEQARASVLQRATWQATAQQYPRYVAAAAAAFSRLCPDEREAAVRDEPWLYCQMMRGEWERRQSRFEPARARFLRLQPQVATLVAGEASGRTQKQFSAEITQQLQLIDAGNNQSVLAVDADAAPQDSAMASDPPLSPAAARQVALSALDAAAAAADAAADATADAAAAAADGQR